MKKLGLAFSALLLGLTPALSQPVTGPAPVGIAGAYNSSPPTCTSGQFCFAQVSSAGRVLVDAAVTGGGDATAANQVLQIAQETAFNTALGLMADAACATDNGTCSTIALIKRGNQRLTTINTTLGTPFQAGGSIGNTTFAATQATAASLNATVVGTGTFATQSAITAASGSFASGSQPIGITPTDRTITSATGSSQTVASALATRKGLIIVNTGNANCGINPTGGTAAIGGAGTLTLTPTGSYQPNIPTLSAITAICTAGQPLYAEEK